MYNICLTKTYYQYSRLNKTFEIYLFYKPEQHSTRTHKPYMILTGLYHNIYKDYLVIQGEARTEVDIS